MSKLVDVDNKENAKTNISKSKNKRPRTASKASKAHCLCRKPDDGSPMIRCEECKEWYVYHFRCVNLSARDAEDVQTYVCPSCHERTGLRTISEYLGSMQGDFASVLAYPCTSFTLHVSLPPCALCPHF
ncbi:hypothetical protein DAEQUDRAFT_706216 [Daedalea quercina L-15889]|uniref:Zinc finger PHD-type domain-containing protein n=1 Tax=Daedalea quercina L-15889 TaxID=1314783 RepID=A0A165SGQ0_9APHY|nr:hypothetical protein DAEQUDRAFT_706216 [Daedalea quercina L-15889]